MATKQSLLSTGNAQSILTQLGSFALCAGLWWVLTGGDARSWLVGGPVVLLATWTAYRCSTSDPWRWRFMGGIRFVPFFLWESLRAGVNVAYHALAYQRVSLNPGLVEYRIRIVQGPARTFFLNTVNLLPGTLVVKLKNNTLSIHVLDIDTDIASEMHRLEVRVADLFGLPLP